VFTSWRPRYPRAAPGEDRLPFILFTSSAQISHITFIHKPGGRARASPWLCRSCPLFYSRIVFTTHMNAEKRERSPSNNIIHRRRSAGLFHLLAARPWAPEPAGCLGARASCFLSF
jgi:hypothetical protein